ncbi:MAG: DUF1016 family protein [Paludibacteraceae bacterium]|nr:DUF1016 family protein [Paludibacteraceae bacterium]
MSTDYKKKLLSIERAGVFFARNAHKIILLCRSKNNTKVEYALRGMTQPFGVAAYKTKELIENLKSSLPSIDDLEKTLND